MITYKDFESKTKDKANKLVCYYDGDQLRFLKNILDGKDGGQGERHEWKNRGFIPRTRNITKMIVDKSGLLFNDPPRLDIVREDGSIVENDTLKKILDKAHWVEFFQNVDPMTRLLKTTVVLLQKYVHTERTTRDGIYRFDENEDALLLTLLHEGNSVVKTNVVGDITQLAYLFDDDGSYYEKNDEHLNVWYYRLITPDVIQDVKVKQDDGGGVFEQVVYEEANPDNIVPAFTVYDTNRPRKGVWHTLPEDIMSMQEFYNLHLTDQEFAIAHQKQKTLFTDTDIVADRGQYAFPHAKKGYTEAGEVYAEIDEISGGMGHLGGLGEVVALEPKGDGSSPYVEFKGPESDLASLNKIATDLIEQIAYDWSVNLHTDGIGRADSGFKLIVEENNNLQLRHQRSRSFQTAFRKMYQIMRVLYPELPEGVLVADFPPPNLPINHKEVEEMWSMKIAEGRASRIDYFVNVHNMTKEEAEQKIAEIDEYNRVIQTVPDFTEDL